jgi:hypothetical protein
MTGADAGQVVQVDSSASPHPERQVETGHAEEPSKLDSLRARWPELSGLLTVDFGLNLVVAFTYLTGVTLVGLGVALILR